MRRAFTLIEVLIVIGIIAVLIGLLTVGIKELKLRSGILLTTNRMEQILTGLAQYRSDAGSQAWGLLQGPLGTNLRFGPVREVIGELNTTSRWPGNLFSSPGNQPPNIHYENNPDDYRIESRLKWYPGDRSESYIGESIDGTLELMPPASLAPTRPTTQWYRDTWPVAWPASDWDQAVPGSIPVIWGTPWGRPPWATAVANGYTYFTGEVSGTPEARHLGQLSPLRTIGLLTAAGILEDKGGAALRDDRSPSQKWNDAWGHPLVIAAGAYVPNRHDTKNANGDMSYQYASRPRDHLLRRSRDAHGFQVAVYLTVGSVGIAPNGASMGLGADLRWSDADDATALAGLWRHIRDTCKAEDWDQDGFTDPPWSGVRREASGSGFCLLMAPIEVQ